MPARSGMIGMRLEEAKTFFKEGEELQRALESAKYCVHFQFGSYVRSDARESIRSRKSSATSGQPPRNRTGLLKDNIYYAVEDSGESVVIGPVRLPRMPEYDGMTVPEILEEGGRVTREVNKKLLMSLAAAGLWDAFWNLKDKRGQKVTFDYDPHPYMGPAFEENLDELDEMWADSIR